jgi:hypothetical protein
MDVPGVGTPVDQAWWAARLRRVAEHGLPLVRFSKQAPVSDMAESDAAKIGQIEPLGGESA